MTRFAFAENALQAILLPSRIHQQALHGKQPHQNLRQCNLATRDGLRTLGIGVDKIS